MTNTRLKKRNPPLKTAKPPENVEHGPGRALSSSQPPLRIEEAGSCAQLGPRASRWALKNSPRRREAGTEEEGVRDAAFTGSDIDRRYRSRT